MRRRSPPLRKTYKQRGSAILFILLGIALFAALLYVFMRGMSSGTGAFSSQKAKLEATEIIDHAQMVERSIDKVRQRGCSETQINFAGAPWNDPNPDAPVDKSCDIFAPEGGQLSVFAENKKWYLDDSGWMGYNGSDAVSGFGQDCDSLPCAELTLTLSGITKELCIALNAQLGITGIPDTSTAMQCPVPQEYYFGCGGNYVALIHEEPELTGKKAACAAVDGSEDWYSFTYVLLSR